MAMVMHAAGCGNTLDEDAPLTDAIEEFIAEEIRYGGRGAICAATMGEANSAPSVVGRLVDVIVTAGNPRLDKDTRQPTGEYFNRYRWGVVSEEDQAAQ